jgi:hypothetical protein
MRELVKEWTLPRILVTSGVALFEGCPLTSSTGARPKMMIREEKTPLIFPRQLSPHYVEMAPAPSPKTSIFLIFGHSFYLMGTRQLGSSFVHKVKIDRLFFFNLVQDLF